MRTRTTVAASALIAVVALVAAAGPATTQTPGTSEPLDGRALAPVVLPLDATTTTPTLEPQAYADGYVAPDQALVDPGTPPLPTARPRVRLPGVSAVVVTKPSPVVTKPSGGTWKRAEYSWYGPGFYGNGTACGQTYSKTILGTAHKTLPCGTKVTFRNPKNGRSITVKVIDRGPYVAGRLWDLSRATCAYLDNCYTSIIQYRLP